MARRCSPPRARPRGNQTLNNQTLNNKTLNKPTTKRLRWVFAFYWLLLLYMVAALVWWFIALNRQNEQMARYREADIQKSDPGYLAKLNAVADDKKRKTAQYVGEGIIFLLLILGGAVFVYQAVRRRLRQGQQQQNFMMAITHELKTPIAVAQLNLQTLQKRQLDPAQQQKLLQNTLAETNRLNALCNNLLLSSQIEAGGYRITLEELDLTALVLESVADFASRIAERALQLTAPPPHQFVNGDRFLLQMAINNLIDNALKYSPKDAPVQLRMVADGGDVLLEVADSGKGIEAADREKIFEKFYRSGNDATKSAKGTGLGLYIVRKIVLFHKGKIGVRGNQPTGSVFFIRLPRQA
jgi:two-component system, OmpR family, sensor histidine kinase CiaH